MIYQDIWVNGKLSQKGIRNCSERYEVIKQYCMKFNSPFTVCDIGANMSYFGLRLIEDFRCSVIAFEFDQFEMRKKIISKNKTKNLMYLNRKISLPDMEILNKTSHFDLVLALSVMHHLPGDHLEWIEQLKNLGDNVIIELALSDSKRPEIRKGYSIPENGTVIGYGDSHLKKNFKRPIIVL